MKEYLLPAVVVGALLSGIPLALNSLTLAAVMAAIAALIASLSFLGLERTSLWSMAAAFALAPCVKFVVPGYRFFNVSDILFTLAIALALPRLLTRRIWLPMPFVLASAVFIAISVLATLQSSNPNDSLYYGARVVLTFIVIPALLVWWAPTGRSLVTLVVAYIVGTGTSVVWGFLHSDGSRNLGLTLHPNVLGYTAVLALSLLPFLLKALPESNRAWIGAAVLVISLGGIMSSGSRAALITALIILVVMPTAEKNLLGALSVLGAGTAAALLVAQQKAPSNGQDALSRLLGSGSAGGSNTARIEGVESVWSLALKHPFLGSGFTFSDFVAHNAYVQIAAAVGFIGLGAFALICLTFLTPLLRHDHLHDRLVYPALVFIVAGPVSPNLTDRYIGFLLGLSMVGVVAVREASSAGVRKRAKVVSGPLTA